MLTSLHSGKKVTAMSNVNYAIVAGLALKHLIKKNYASQQEFAEDFGVELRTVNRYVTSGIGKLVTIEEIADFFGMDLLEYLHLGKELAK